MNSPSNICSVRDRLSTALRARGIPPSGDVAMRISCGSFTESFGDRAGTDAYHNPLLLDEFLMRHSNPTFFVQIGAHEEMVISENTFLGVRVGDILTIDRSMSPSIGSLVLAVCENKLTLCRFTEHEGRRFLVCKDKKGYALELTDNSTVRIWGVVSALSRRL